MAASIDVKVLDRAGYNTEEYVSPTDGKTYFRQVLVEETGFNFDILMTVYDGDTGEQVLSEQITDFKERSDRKLRESEDMFAGAVQPRQPAAGSVRAAQRRGQANALHRLRRWWCKPWPAIPSPSGEGPRRQRATNASQRAAM